MSLNDQSCKLRILPSTIVIHEWSLIVLRKKIVGGVEYIPWKIRIQMETTRKLLG